MPDKHKKRIRRITINSVTGLSGDRFRFDENGDGPARYKIKHFKQVSDGKYEWITVGEYLEGVLKLDMSGKNLRCLRLLELTLRDGRV